MMGGWKQTLGAVIIIPTPSTNCYHHLLALESIAEFTPLISFSFASDFRSNLRGDRSRLLDGTVGADVLGGVRSFIVSFDLRNSSSASGTYDIGRG